MTGKPPSQWQYKVAKLLEWQIRGGASKHYIGLGRNARGLVILFHIACRFRRGILSFPVHHDRATCVDCIQMVGGHGTIRLPVVLGNNVGGLSCPRCVVPKRGRSFQGGRYCHGCRLARNGHGLLLGPLARVQE